MADAIVLTSVQNTYGFLAQFETVTARVTGGRDLRLHQRLRAVAGHVDRYVHLLHEPGEAASGATLGSGKRTCCGSLLAEGEEVWSGSTRRNGLMFTSRKGG